MSSHRDYDVFNAVGFLCISLKSQEDGDEDVMNEGKCITLAAGYSLCNS